MSQKVFIQFLNINPMGRWGIAGSISITICIHIGIKRRTNDSLEVAVRSHKDRRIQMRATRVFKTFLCFLSVLLNLNIIAAQNRFDDTKFSRIKNETKLITIHHERCKFNRCERWVSIDSTSLKNIWIILFTTANHLKPRSSVESRSSSCDSNDSLLQFL